jgi:hypothetical protein
MGTVYLARKKGSVVHHTSIQAMGEIDGVEPEKEVTDQEFEAAEGLVRIIGNKIILGKTEAEKNVESKQKRITEIDQELSEIEKRTGTGRAPRALLLEYAESAGLGGADVQKLQEAENQAQTLRAERQSILESMG